MNRDLTTWRARSADELRREILARIADGEWQAADKIPTIRTVSQGTGLAFVTVRKTFHCLARDGFLASRGRQGTFVTNKRVRLSQPAAGGSRRSIYFVYDRSLQTAPGRQLNHFYLAVLNGAEQAAYARRHQIVYKPIDHELGRTGVDELAAARHAGVLLVGEEIDHTLAFLLQARRLPVVLVDHYVDPSFSSVVVECRVGVMQAVRYLLEHGHRRIAFIGGPPEFPSIRNKLAGFHAAFRRAGLRIPAELIRCYGQYGEIPVLISELLGRAAPPTAILCGHDYVSLQVLELLRRRGCRVPEDLALAGCDDIEPAASATPPLATIRIDKERIGRLAVELLLAGPRSPRVVTVSGEFIPRPSVHTTLGGKGGS